MPSDRPDDTWEQFVCEYCGQPFVDQDDWFDRHFGPEGEELHADCCYFCNPQLEVH